MNIFDFFVKKAKPIISGNNILLAMPIFNNGDRYQVGKIIANLKSQWDFEITDFEGDDDASSFNINGETIALAYIDAQIPWDDIEGTAEYAYNWPRSLEELKDHNGHAIVSVMHGQKSSLERFGILSKLLSSILMTSKAIGIYQGNQSLLIPRNQYLANLNILEEGDIPVNLWIYIGLRNSANGNNAYTYGLTEFQKKEIEIIDSTLSLEELFDFLSNILSYIISNDITLKTGETMGMTIDQKIAIASSKGRFVEGESIKLKI